MSWCEFKAKDSASQRVAQDSEQRSSYAVLKDEKVLLLLSDEEKDAEECL